MLKLLLGDPNARKLKRYQPIVSDINLLEEEVTPLSDEELRGLTTEFCGKLAEVTLERKRKLLTSYCPRSSLLCSGKGGRCW
jgi:preprotein translocase subunit SecA